MPTSSEGNSCIRELIYKLVQLLFYRGQRNKLETHLPDRCDRFEKRVGPISEIKYH
jgi:hypothetical protein